jgi:hypothetical protein
VGLLGIFDGIAFLVGTGIEARFGVLDRARLEALLAAAEA